jgi:DNA-binding Xre family transcriptional regulator
MPSKDSKTELQQQHQVNMVKKIAHSGPGHRGVYLPGLWYCRVARSLSQRELAELVGMSQTSIQQLEAEVRGAYPSTIRKLSQALNVGPTDLYAKTSKEIDHDE